jgi:tetratricopeptide (TPR) repeat protein
MKLVTQAKVYREQGEYHLALTCAQGSGHPDAYAEAARALVWLGRYDEAIQAAARGRELRDGPAIWIASSEAQIAGGYPQDGIVSARTALERSTRPSEIGLSRVVEASALHVLGDGTAAVSVARQALDDLVAGRPYDQALALHALAESLHVAGRHPEAADVWRQLMALRQEVLAKNHPEIGSTVNGMGLTLRRLGLAEVAVDLHEQALVIYLERLDDQHPAIAAARHGLAQALHRLGQHQAAREQLAQALEVSEIRQGPDHPHTWITRFELGRIEVDCGMLTDGYRRMEASRLRLTELLGPRHPTIQAIRNWL